MISKYKYMTTHKTPKLLFLYTIQQRNSNFKFKEGSK